MSYYRQLFLVTILIFMIPVLVWAGDVEQNLSTELREGQCWVVNTVARLATGETTAAEVGVISQLTERIRADHLLLKERYAARMARLLAVSDKAVERHQMMVDEYMERLETLLFLLDDILQDGMLSRSELEALGKNFDQLISRKKLPIHGVLPYMNPGYQAKEPRLEPTVVPAYKGGTHTVTADDTKNTPEAPLTWEIATLANLLQWNPVLIYEWVKNNVKTEWYWGCMKGAEETLRQRSGNDADQATLLTALLRASGFPCRYVRGVIEFFPDVTMAQNLTGITSPSQIAILFRRAGIPCKPIIVNNQIVNFQIEHVWVESEIPYSNYRGGVLDNVGKVWLGLDTSIKSRGLAWNGAADPTGFSLDTLRDDYLQFIQTLTPLEFVRSQLGEFISYQHLDMKYQDFLSDQTIIPDVLNIIPSSLQFNQIAITGEFPMFPQELKHSITVSANSSAGDELFSISLDSSLLSNQRVALSYEPESIEDQQIIDSFGGLDNTPGYLIRLRPVLKLNGERLVVARDGLPMGTEYTVAIEVLTPNGPVQISNTHTVGNIAVIGVVAQNALPNPTPVEGDDAETILFKEAAAYVYRWTQAEDELSALLKLVVSRPLPSIVTIGGLIDTNSLFGTPHGFEWKGVFIDAALRGIETVSTTNDNGRERAFMQLSALQGSILENRIFEDDFKIESISTAKLLQLANSSGTPLITIDKTNISELLPSLPFDEVIKSDITDSVNHDLVVRIPITGLTYQDWTGSGYLKENLTTGAAGWMLSGMVAGGYTTWGAYRWNDPIARMIAERLQNPYAGPPNQNPSEARSIGKIPASDLQFGKAGAELGLPLQVMVLDAAGKPVTGVDVTFSVRAGGGGFSNGDNKIVVQTEANGIASARIVLGKMTADNPIFFLEAGKKYGTRVGENIIDASLPTGVSIITPLVAYGFPGEPHHMRPVISNDHGDVLTYAGSAGVVMEDENGNPLSNIEVNFVASPVLSDCSSSGASQASLIPQNSTCFEKYPVVGECAEASATHTILTDSYGSAWVGVLLGTIPSLTYPVNITGAGFSQLLRFTSYELGNGCDEEQSPELKLRGVAFYTSDINGNNINAGKTGTSVTAKMRMYYLREGETTISRLVSCDTTNDNQILCDNLIGSRKFTVDTDFISTEVTVAGRDGLNEGNGLFSGTYTLKPGVNDIQIIGAADIKQEVMQTCPVCEKVERTKSDYVFTNIRFYGVDIDIAPVFIVVDPNGYSLKDYVLQYAIKPAEYSASTAFIMIYKDGEPILSIPSEVTGSGTATILKGFQFDIKSKYQVEVVLNVGTGVEIRSDKIPVTLGGILLPDYNRNGQIDDEDAKLAISHDSYHFWINDDNDEGETEGDDIPENSSPNSEDSNVNGVRDLVDFFPVFIDLKRYITTMVGGPYKYFIRTNLGSMNFAYAPQLLRDKSGNYLTDVDTARALGEVETYIITPEGIELDAAFIDKIVGTEGAGIILVEGRKAAKDSLILDVVDSGGTTVFSYRLNVGLAGVEQMFRHKNLTANGVITIEPDAEDPSNLLPGKAPENGEPDRLGEPTNFSDNEACDPLNEQNFVFVHGYNVNGQQARGWHAEMFKRMYWSGSKAKFWGVTWYGWRTQQYYPIYGYRTSHYRLNVRQAFNTAGEFKNFVANVGDNVTIAAHSLGNIVVLSAIQDHGLTNFARYYMINAAVALEALDAATPTSIDMDHIDWDGYDPKLFASEWYMLFLNDIPQDERAKLTWRDRFNDIPYEKIYNFYSSSDEVFEPHPHDDVPGTEDITLFDLTMIGRQTWALQEKLKGRNVLFDVGNVNGGWGFNLDDYYREVLDMSVPDPNLVPKVRVKLEPDETELLSQQSSELRIAPFFLRHEGDRLLYTEENGSEYSKLHKDRLLAEAFPARTGAIGRNVFAKITEKFNFNMQTFILYHAWPRENYQWLHCDLKDLAYPFVSQLFKKFTYYLENANAN